IHHRQKRNLYLLTTVFERKQIEPIYNLQITFMKKYHIWVVLFLLTTNSFAQENKNLKDSLYINEIEEIKTPAKNLHAEPLYIDLIRDLGARKGEKEWNIGMGITDN